MKSQSHIWCACKALLVKGEMGSIYQNMEEQKLVPDMITNAVQMQDWIIDIHEKNLDSHTST